MIDMHFLVAAVLVLALLPAAAAPPQGTRANPAAASAASVPPPLPVARRTPFTHFGSAAVLELRGNAGAATVDFGSRADELITKASFHFRYAYSPALVEERSHIRLTLNGEVIGLLPVTSADSGRTVARDVDVDPRLFVGFNKLAMEFVAQRGAGPDDPARPGPWADVSGSSELEIAARPLVVADDLALLPEPFFDRRDQRRVNLPFLFGAQPSLPTLRAASIVASWFGQLAGWRGARFPARLDETARGHAVAFVANDERPALLASLPPAGGPALRVMTNPADGHSKLLLVLGRDGRDLATAASALVLGNAAMSGAAMIVKEVAQAPPPPAYEVPGWVRLDRATRLGERIGWPQQLETAGLPPALAPIRVDLRMPPDLVTWRGPGVPMALGFRYTPPACAGESHLDVSINDELLKVVALRTAYREGEAATSGPPLPAAIADASEIFIPAYRLRGRNQLQFAFRFGPGKEGACRDARPEAVRAVIDADSTIDFSGFPHYARMPNLGFFVSAGFPFTRYADLSQTVAVVPERPDAPDIETLLTLMGRLGESTGRPATGVRVASASQQSRFADADLLVIGASPQQALLEQWNEQLPVVIAGPARRINPPERRTDSALEWLGLGKAPDFAVAGPVSLEGAGPLAALLGFESPLASGRSVVAVTAVAPAQLVRVLDALDDPALRGTMRGSAVLVHPDKVESLRVGRDYELGFLPPWTGLWHRLSGFPVLLAALSALALAFLAYAGWRANRALAAWRSRRRP